MVTRSTLVPSMAATTVRSAMVPVARSSSSRVAWAPAGRSQSPPSATRKLRSASSCRRDAGSSIDARTAVGGPEAAERGAFGAPTFFVDGEMHWGQDRLDWVVEAVAR